MSQADETARLIDSPSVDDESTKHETTGHIWKLIPPILIILLLDGSTFLSLGPELAIIQQVACHAHYKVYLSTDVIDENRCREDKEVQKQVAFIMAWNTALSVIPGVLCMVPYGILADRIGRKKVLLLSIVGCALSATWETVVCYFPNMFPLRLVYLSGLWQFIGGGGTTLSTIVWVMIADHAPPSKRTSVFSQVHAVALVAEVIAVAIAAPLMAINPWIPWFIAYGCIHASLAIVTLFVPESFTPRKETSKIPEPTLKRLSDVLQYTTRHANVVLILLSFFLVQVGQQVKNLLLQYAAHRFHWKLSQASYLLMIRSLTAFAVLIAIPFLIQLADRDLDHVRKMYEKRYAQISVLLAIIGALASFVAFHPSILVTGQILNGLGAAFNVMARSVVTSMVKQDRLGMLYGVIGVAMNGGAIIGSLILAQVWAWGLQLKGSWAGLPYLAAAGIFTIALMAVSAAKLSDIDRDASEDQGREDNEADN